MIRSALSSMGYREVRNGVWAKPMGYQLFLFREDNQTWYNYFKDIKGKISLWQSKKGLGDSPLRNIKEFECWTKHDLHCNGDSNFQLSSLEENELF